MTNTSRVFINKHLLIVVSIAYLSCTPPNSLFYLEGDLGLINPATTGKIWGGLVAIKNSILLDNYNVNIQPKFNENVFHIQGTTKIHFYPVVLAWRLGKVYFGSKL